MKYKYEKNANMKNMKKKSLAGAVSLRPGSKMGSGGFWFVRVSACRHLLIICWYE
jgi:hypothetical protein